MLPVHEFSKIKKVVHCTPGGGGGKRGQSLIKVRRSDSKVFTKSVSAVKMLPRADTIPHFDSKLKTCDLEFIKALKLDLERTKTLKNATMSGKKFHKWNLQGVDPPVILSKGSPIPALYS